MSGLSAKFRKVITRIEIIGNKLPHPFWIFNILSIAVIAGSFFLQGTSNYVVENGNFNLIQVNNLLDMAYLVNIFGNQHENFIMFKPLAIVILILMGVSVFQQSGALSAIIRSIFGKTPIKYIVGVVAFIGVNGNLASDVSVIVIPTICAGLFQSLNMNPWLGIIVGYASVNGGFTLNMLIAATDMITSEITCSVTETMGLNENVHALSNYYFMFVGSIFLIIITVLVAENVTKRVLGCHEDNIVLSQRGSFRLSKRERAGLKYFIYANILYFLGIYTIWIYMKKSDLNITATRMITDNMVGWIFIYFTVTGTAFGLKAGTIKSLEELPKIFAIGISGVKEFIVTAFSASLFIRVLNDSNLVSWLVSWVSALFESIQMPPLLILLLFILGISIFNLFITSNSVKWVFIASFAIPIFSELNISANVVQVAYRIGDTATNCISPVDYYLPIIISLLDGYKADGHVKVGIGTVVSLALPYSIAYLIGLIILFMVWYLLGLPFGPSIV
ncbi:MAG: AbgT family transporter [Anaeromicrobium sp.]|jgi:aminobenzoyl-glutamate transport protein|uniref:AbgT family transporter n=1 Tax=Anaeromicrobium sp. TaxID=1929132 RepID=UPI0025D3CE80|nr:AbgT family transporter [Anaeromicrobium sp.]MCT4594792.1 AbgT family transporter [Anaeromicrobium sp.]